MPLAEREFPGALTVYKELSAYVFTEQIYSHLFYDNR